MLYFDTSFLIPLVRSEASSALISAFFRQAKFDQLAVSHWTLVEFFSVIARDVRARALGPDAAARANAQFETMIADPSWSFCPMRRISKSRRGT